MNAEQALGIKEKATEETLQSIDGTLKRIEKILLLLTEPKSVSVEVSKRNSNDLVVEHT